MSTEIVRWDKDISMTFTGRSGNGYCCGISIYRHRFGPVNKIMISPITSRDHVAKGCDIDIPFDKLDEVIEALQKYRKANDNGDKSVG